MQASDSVSAVFDDPNLVSVAGLVLALARRAGLHDLAAEHLSVPDRSPSRSRNLDRCRQGSDTRSGAAVPQGCGLRDTPKSY